MALRLLSAVALVASVSAAPPVKVELFYEVRVLASRQALQRGRPGAPRRVTPPRVLC